MDEHVGTRSCRMRSRAAALASSLAVCLAAVLCSAVQAGGGLLSPGTRITYYVASASVPGTRVQAIWDPNCDPATQDCWVDEYGRSIGQQEVASAAGQSFVVVDVLWSDGHACVTRETTIVIDVLSGGMNSSSGGTVSAGTSCGDYWLHPQLLGQMRPAWRAPLRVGNAVIDSLGFVDYTAGSAMQRTYDADSGLLVSGSSRVSGASAPVIRGSAIEPAAGSTHLAYVQLVGVRAIDARAPAGPLPEHVRGIGGLSYGCLYRSQIYGQVVDMPCESHMQVTARGDGWLMLQGVLTMVYPNQFPVSVEQVITIAAGAPLGGFYACPGLLQTLQPGMLVDADPVTGIRTTVGQADGGSVQVVEEGNAERRTLTYDLRSGWLTSALTERQHAGGMVTASWLQLQQTW